MINPHFVSFFVLFIICKRSSQSSEFFQFFKKTDSCECGKHNELSIRIVGGKETEPHDYPWMVAIFNQGKMHCGGSLINDRYVLTAGHCLNWSKKEDLSVVLGVHDRVLVETMKRGGLAVDIENIIVHEDFSSDYLHDIDDIGLIKLKKAIAFTSEIRPVCLPKKGSDYSRKVAKVTGWGRTSQKGEPSRLLREAKVTVISNRNCRKIIGEHILDSMLCAYEHEVDACQGDSGGPLVSEMNEGKVEQIGVVSWGIGCAKPGVPGVYTRITSYLEWIALHTTDAIFCENPV